VNAAIVISVRQDDTGVVVSGSGRANTTNLTARTLFLDYTNVFTNVQIYAGPAAFTGEPPAIDVERWSGLSGPLIFGNDPNISANPSSGLGHLFGIIADNNMGQSFLVLPLNYLSGANLEGSSRFDGYTLADLGLSPGQFSWTWGMNGNADSLELRIEPLPAPAPLPLAGGAVAWSLAKRMRRASRHQRRQNHFRIPTQIL
jgi:hypothetical protein